ncbi:unnamed protein product [Hapterophycus canaliculatus]
MDATDEFRAQQVAKGLPADAPLPPWFLRDLEENKAKEAEAEREKAREAVRSSNPFMMQEGLPEFESITPEASKEAFDVLLEDLETGFAKFEEDLIDFTSSDSWPKVVTIFQKMGQSKEVYDALKFLQVPACQRLMTEAQMRVVDASVKQMELGGVGLEGEAKEEFNKIQLELADLSTKFSNNVLDATKAFSLTLTDKAEVEGLPASALGLAAQSAKVCQQRRGTQESLCFARLTAVLPSTTAAGDENATPEDGPWRLTLDMPSYLPCMQHLKNREVTVDLQLADL